MSLFSLPNTERKKCLWTTKFNRLLEMCFVKHVEKKCVFIFQPMKRLISTTAKKAKLDATFWIFLLRTKNQKPTIFLSGGDGTHCFAKRPVANTKQRNHYHFWRIFSANHNQAHPNLNQKGQKFFQLWHNRVDTPSVDRVNQNFIHILFQYTFSLLESNLIFSVSNERIEWCLEFRPDSVPWTVNWN